MVQRSTAKSVLLVLTTLLLRSSLANSVENLPKLEEEPKVKVKHYLSNAIQVDFTPRGETYFLNNSLRIFSNGGVYLNAQKFENLNSGSQKSYQLDSLKTDANTQKLVTTIRGMLKSWFVGFSISEVRPAVQIANSSYQAEFSQFAISTDENLLDQLKKTEGAILVLNMDIKGINYQAAKIRLWDQDKPKLGQVGFDDVKVKMADGSGPLHVRIPFYVKINSQGVPEYEAVGIDENIDTTNFEFKYGKFIVPTIQLVINGEALPFNDVVLGQELVNSTPIVITEIRNYLHDFASHQIPTLLNEKSKEYLVQALENVKHLQAPNTPDGASGDLWWGMQFKSISENNGLTAKFNCYVEDPVNPDSMPNTLVSATRPPLASTLNKADYDVALSIDEGMINRIMQLSYERKFFEKIALDTTNSSSKDSTTTNDGKFLRLTQTPILKPIESTVKFTDSGSAPNWGETFAKLQLSVQVPPGTVTGLETLIMKDRFFMNVDLIVKLVKTKDAKGVSILLWDFDPDSFKIDARNFTILGKIAKGLGLIMSSLKSQFSDMSVQWRADKLAMPGSIPVPSILGVPLGIKHLAMEQNGHLILYLNYSGPPSDVNASITASVNASISASKKN